MRAVRLSTTALDQLEALLMQGLAKFGPRVVDQKREAVLATIEKSIAGFPAAKPRHPTLNLVAYPVSRTPFVLLYDFDDSEVRVHFVVHRRASLEDLDPAAAEW